MYTSIHLFTLISEPLPVNDATVQPVEVWARREQRRRSSWGPGGCRPAGRVGRVGPTDRCSGGSPRDGAQHLSPRPPFCRPPPPIGRWRWMDRAAAVVIADTAGPKGPPRCSSPLVMMISRDQCYLTERMTFLRSDGAFFFAECCQSWS